jgi:hypothetical protein
MRSMTVVSPTGRNIFGRCFVIGHRRVAYPPASTTAFMPETVIAAV